MLWSLLSCHNEGLSLILHFYLCLCLPHCSNATSTTISPLPVMKIATVGDTFIAFNVLMLALRLFRAVMVRTVVDTFCKLY